MDLSTIVRLNRSLPLPDDCLRIRTAARVSRHAVAVEVGVTAESVRLWEIGDRRPTGEHLERYVAALDVMSGGQ